MNSHNLSPFTPLLLKRAIKHDCNAQQHRLVSTSRHYIVGNGDRPEQPYNNERLEVSVALGQAYFAAGHTTKAERVFEDVLDWLPSIEPYLAEQALYLLRDIFTQTMKYGQYDAAIKMLEQYPSELDLNQAYWQSRLMCFIESST